MGVSDGLGMFGILFQRLGAEVGLSGTLKYWRGVVGSTGVYHGMWVYGSNEEIHVFLPEGMLERFYMPDIHNRRLASNLILVHLLR